MSLILLLLLYRYYYYYYYKYYYNVLSVKLYSISQDDAPDDSCYCFCRFANHTTLPTHRKWMPPKKSHFYIKWNKEQIMCAALQDKTK